MTSLPARSMTLTLKKLTDVIAEENRRLTVHDLSDHTELTEQKNQALRELMAMQGVGLSSEAIAWASPDLERLKSLLVRNAWLLKTHIAAMGDITDVIIAGLREAESDGTYARIEARRGR